MSSTAGKRRRVLERILELVAILHQWDKEVLSYEWIKLVMSKDHQDCFENVIKSCRGDLLVSQCSLPNFFNSTELKFALVTAMV